MGCTKDTANGMMNEKGGVCEMQKTKLALKRNLKAKSGRLRRNTFNEWEQENIQVNEKII